MTSLAAYVNRACSKHQILISPLVAEEIRDTPDAQERTVIERQLRRARYSVISGERRATALARALMTEGKFGQSMLADLTHVGYAILGGADALVTWDRRTLARQKVRLAVDVLCRREGTTAPLIGIPEEVGRWLDLKM